MMNVRSSQTRIGPLTAKNRIVGKALMLLDVKDKEKMVQDDRDVDMRLSPPMMKVF